MTNAMNKEQQKKLSFAFMWYGDWKQTLHSDKADMSYDEMVDREETMQWYAHMAVRECYELGLDPELLFNSNLIRHAWEYRNEVLPKALAKTRKELKAEGII